jgi:hypothetical protein
MEKTRLTPLRRVPLVAALLFPVVLAACGQQQGAPAKPSGVATTLSQLGSASAKGESDLAVAGGAVTGHTIATVDLAAASYLRTSAGGAAGRPWTQVTGSAVPAAGDVDRGAFLAAALLDPRQYLAMTGPPGVYPNGMFPTSAPDTAGGAALTRYQAQCQFDLHCRLGDRLQAWVQDHFPRTHFVDVTLWLDPGGHLRRFAASSVLMDGRTDPTFTLTATVSGVGTPVTVQAPPPGQVAT